MGRAAQCAAIRYQRVLEVPLCACGILPLDPPFPATHSPRAYARKCPQSFYDPSRGEVRAVDGVDCHLDPGVVALVGANGAGKTTLLRMVATLLRPDHGRVIVAGHDTRTEPRAVRARSLATCRPAPGCTNA